MAYSTTAELTAYATARGIVLTSDLDVLLVKAHDFIESNDFKGDKLFSDQESKWPRSSVIIDGVLLSNSIVPQGVKNAEMQTACELDSGLDPLANIERATKSEQLADMSVTYMDTASQSTRLTKINALLRPYLSGGMGQLVRG